MAKSPFEYADSVSASKINIWDDQVSDSEYVPFVVNKSLSYHLDSLLIANLVNQYHALPKRLQYQLYLNTLRPRKRFAKWAKKESDDAVIAVIQRDMDMTARQAKAAMSLLSEEQIKQLLENREGGREK